MKRETYQDCFWIYPKDKDGFPYIPKGVIVTNAPDYLQPDCHREPVGNPASQSVSLPRWARTDEAVKYREFQAANSKLPVANKYKFNTIVNVSKTSAIRPKYFFKKKRGLIKTFSKGSSRRFMFAYDVRPVEFSAFITVTFPPELNLTYETQRNIWKYLQVLCVDDTQQTKKHLYLWARELHKLLDENQNERPHYHFLMSGNFVDIKLLMQKLRFYIYGLIRENLKNEYPADWAAIYGYNWKTEYMKRLPAFNSRMFKVDTVINNEKASSYLAKTCAYMQKKDQKSKSSFRRWGRNYKDVPLESVIIQDFDQCEVIRFYQALSKGFKFPRRLSLRAGILENADPFHGKKYLPEKSIPD